MATAQARQDEIPNVALIEAGIAADIAKVKDRAAKDAEFKAVIQKDLATLGLDPNNPETLINIALATSPLGAGEKAAADITRGVLPRVIEGVKHIPEGLQKIKAALPQTVQDVLPMSVRDLGHLMFTPQNASPVRLAKFEELLENGEATRAVKMQHASIPYASITVAGSSVYAANKVVDYANSKEAHYESYADRFKHDATQEYKQRENLEQLKAIIPEMAKPIDKFLEMQDQLAKDGNLSQQDKKAMALVAENFSNIIKTEGPDSKSFDSVQNVQDLSR